jgi:hypothetical protein
VPLSSKRFRLLSAFRRPPATFRPPATIYSLDSPSYEAAGRQLCAIRSFRPSRFPLFSFDLVISPALLSPYFLASNPFERHLPLHNARSASSSSRTLFPPLLPTSPTSPFPLRPSSSLSPPSLHRVVRSRSHHSSFWESNHGVGAVKTKPQINPILLLFAYGQSGEALLNVSTDHLRFLCTSFGARPCEW